MKAEGVEQFGNVWTEKTSLVLLLDDREMLQS